MPCTTILVGKNASYDGSTLMARNEDSGFTTFDPKKFIVVLPEEQPRKYKSVLSSFEIDLPDNPMRYTAMPNAIDKDGIWGETGFNEENIAMSETETITSNPRVLGADPLVKQGIGEEDMLTIVLPYIHSAREGVIRLGSILEQYGTYEMNAIGFQDMDEIWWLESIGGHHWIAKKVPDDSYVVMPNQLGIDCFDMVDAFTEQKEHMCSSDLIAFIKDNFLDVSKDTTPVEKRTDLNPRTIFGSHSDFDHVYNTPRAWFMGKCLNPNTYKWDGPESDFTPESDNIPWSFIPENKITIEDIKYVLSSYYQGTEFNPYSTFGPKDNMGKYRPIGINRNNFVAITQLRPYVPKEICAIEWMSVGCNAFNGSIPFYANITKTPAYLANTDKKVTTENFYWANRMIGALVDTHYQGCMAAIDEYKEEMLSNGHAFISKFDTNFDPSKDVHSYLEACNEVIAQYAKEATYNLLDKVLYVASNEMKNKFSRSDA